MWLFNNGLSGDIPSELGNLTILDELLLGPNPLSPTTCVPASLRYVRRLELGGLDLPFCGQPVLVEGSSAERSIAEDAAVGAEVGARFEATYAGPNTLAYSLSGDGSSAFDIDSATGQIETRAALNYEARSTYSVTVTVSDGVLTDGIAVTITVTDVDGETPSAPAAPTVVAGATVGETTLDVSWAVPVNTGPPIKDYNIQYRVGSSGGFTAARFSGVGTRASITGLSPDTTYEVQVRAVNDEGAGPWSASGRGETKPTPGVPPVFTARCSNGVAVPNPDTNTGLVEDCAILLGARDALAWTAFLDWTEDVPIADWAGVTVGGAPDRVQELRFYRKGLAGIIPPELGDLTNLTHLELRDNRLTGVIPPELGNLANLEDLFLDSNRLTGAIPSELGDLTNLTHLVLTGNGLSGAIPPELGDLTNLEDLLLGNNGLTGTIPTALVELTSLKRLQLHRNRLTGVIPPGLGGLTNLTSLALYSNQLTGPIPPQLGALTELDELHLSDNRLTGAIPLQLAALTKLGYLVLSSNQLTGLVPPELGLFTNLYWLALSNNQLAGAMPSELGNLSSLRLLWLSNNRLSGDIPSELGNLANLDELLLGPNPFSPTTCVPASLRYVKTLELGGLNLPFCGQPVLVEGSSAERSIAEDAAVGAEVGARFEATYAGPNTLTYSLSGDGSSAFDIDSATGQIETRAALNYEARSTYSVTVTVSDGVLTDGIAVTITVMDVDGEAPVAPAAPTVVAGATDGETTLDVKWEAPVNTGPPIKDYNIQYRVGSSGGFSPVRFSGVGLGATIKELSPGTTYEVQVKAVNDEGTGQWSSSGQGETKPTPNRSPVFTEGDGPINRSIPENTAAGDPIGGRVSATDADANDVLGYSLGGADATAFDIDSATGQIETRVALNYEARSTYSVTVTVSDGVLTAGIAVRIRVTNVAGEAPAVPAAPSVVAGATDGETTLDVKWEAPVNTGPRIENYSIRYRAGSSGEFSPVRFSGVGLGAIIKELRTGTTYEVQVKAVNDEGTSLWSASGQGATAIPGAPARPTGLTATAGEGDVRLSWTDPVDPTVTKWQYSIRGDNGRYDEWSDVPNSNTSTTSYRVTGLDNRKGYAFSVRAVNIAGPGLAAAIVVNTAPVFPGAQNGATDRSVAENAGEGEAVGSPVVATDPNGDALTYALGGPDAASFAIDEDTGQIRVGAGTTLDYETKSSYAVEVTAADPSDAGATIAVTITVNNVDLPGRGNDYDADGNEEIDRDEAIAALADYFGGAISQEQAIGVILLYFAG